jgi:hypothetical protein
MRLRKNVVEAKDGGMTWAVMGMHEVVGYRQRRGETKKNVRKIRGTLLVCGAFI